MELDEIIKTIESILDGIDKDETQDKNGWWETSTGAAFGKQKLEELKVFVTNQLILSMT